MQKFLIYLLFSLHLLIASVETAAQTADSTLIRLPKLTYESPEELIKAIEQTADITISYSNKVLPQNFKHVNIRHRQWQLYDILQFIFGRFSVQFTSTTEGKVIVTARNPDKLHSITGYLRDKSTGEVLIGANITDTLLLRGTASNGYGFFQLRIPEGNVPLRFSFVGYQSITKNIHITSDTILTVQLTPVSHKLDFDINSIAPQNYSANQPGSGDIISLPMKQVKALPTLMGEGDVFRAITNTTGIQSGAEGFGGLSVRGGSTDQNLVLLDEIPIYNPTHLMGLYTVFNAEAINSASLIKGGMPARYGSRLSSVIDIKLRDGNMKRFQGSANVGLLASQAQFEGPIKKDTVSFIISGRRTYFDAYSFMFQRNNFNRYSFYFYDVSAKVNYFASVNNRFFLSFFMSNDNLKNRFNKQKHTVKNAEGKTQSQSTTDEQRFDWGNIVAALRWNHISNKNLFSNTTLWFSHFQFNNRINAYVAGPQEPSGGHYYSGINDLGLKARMNAYPSISLLKNIVWGADITAHNIVPGISLSNNDSTSINNFDIRRKRNAYQIEGHTYAELHVLYRQFYFNAGLHLSLLHRRLKSPFVQVEPRLLTVYKPNDNFTASLGLSVTSQFIQQIRIATVNTPADMWLPVSHKLSPPRALQMSVKFHYSTPSDWHFTIEGYRKKYNRLEGTKSSSMVQVAAGQNWEEIYKKGNGFSNGLEVMIHRKNGLVSGWLAYSLCNSWTRFEDIDNYKYSPADYSRRHFVTLYTVYTPSPDIDISAIWKFGTGLPLTLPEGSYNANSGPAGLPDINAPVMSTHNAYQMPAMHQLDIGMNLRKKTRHGLRTISVGISNVYSRQNPMFVYFNANESKLKQFSLVPYPWPYVKYQFEF